MTKTANDGTLYQVTLPYACYGVIVEDGRVIEAAPIARWAVGKSLNFAANWIEGKGGNIVACHGKLPDDGCTCDRA